MITIKQTGDFKKTSIFLKGIQEHNMYAKLRKYGEEGVRALAAATPVDTGETARSWDYEIHYSKDKVEIVWTNSHIVGYIPVAMLIQYGHATKNGGYVKGRDYINPALKPIFDKMSKETWKEVTK